MGKNVQHIQHIKSNVVENGSPKLPTPSVLAEGEIAVNFAEGYETLSIKSSSGNIKTFSSDEYYTEQKLGSGFTDNDVTVTEAIDELEVIIADALSRKSDTGHTHESSGVTAMTGYDMAASGTSISSADTLNTAIGKLEKMIDELKDYIEQKEFAIAAAITDLDDRIKSIK
jgi:hypothetical protein